MNTTAANKIKVEWVPVEKITPYPNNAKLHSDSDTEKLALEIRTNGWDQQIVVDEDWVIIKGHGRRLAAIHNIEHHGAENKVPVFRRTDLTEEQKKAMRIADNKLGETGWDNALLCAELVSFQEFPEFDIALTGFSEVEIAKIVNGKTMKDSEGAVELDQGSFTKFSHQCPKCGFEFDN
jgi:ParB-like chromosome segregation protein Spo0J